MLAIRVLQSNGKEVRGLLKRKRVYEDKYLPRKVDDDILLPIRKSSEQLLKQVKGFAPEARVEDAELRENRRTRSFRRELQKIMPKDIYDEASRAYEQIGDVGVITVFPRMEPYENEIAEALMDTNKGIRIVVKKASRTRGKDRTPDYVTLAGEGTTETTHVESGVTLHLDIKDVYFSSRTFEERKRIASLVRPGEDVLVLFSGIAPYVLVIAKNSEANEVWGVEQSDVAHAYAVENTQLNKVDNVHLIQGDVREAAPSIKLRFDRIVMPHPTEADHFLPDALALAKDNAVLHLYLFSRDDMVEQAKQRLKGLVMKEGFAVSSMDVVEQMHVSPTVHKYCFDIRVKRSN